MKTKISRQRKWAIRNTDKVRVYRRKWYKKNREKQLDYQRKYRARLAGKRHALP